MVDAWTQWLLAPIHEAVFSVLRRLPQDGTFDQLAPVERLITRMQAIKPLKHTWVYSIDLSAATDRLPIRIQMDLMSLIFRSVANRFFRSNASRLSELWRELLVGRAYSLYVPTTQWEMT
jgi:hypothetical protein